MEPYMLPFFIFAALLLISVGIVQGCDKWESEDQAQYEHLDPRVELVREVHHKEPRPLQTTDSAVTVGKKPEKAAVSGHDLGETKSVHSVMVKKVYYCREYQSVDEARRIMREHDLPYLPVLDSNLRVVGTVRMRDLMLGDEDRPQSGG